MGRVALERAWAERDAAVGAAEAAHRAGEEGGQRLGKMRAALRRAEDEVLARELDCREVCARFSAILLSSSRF
jgi:hypothetical protein